jgi:AcrR family transcriptional regulator
LQTEGLRAERPVDATGGHRSAKRRTDTAIFDATRELLAEVGVPGLTIEGVAARAGVAKTTIYRRWRSKEDLALALLLDMVAQVSAVPDLGDTRAELTAFVNGAVDVLGSTLMGRVMQGLVSELAYNPGLAKLFREQIVAARIGEVRRLVDRGVERGDLRPGTEYELAHELLFGPVYYRLLLSGGLLDHRLGRNIVDAFMRAFSPPGSTAP